MMTFYSLCALAWVVHGLGKWWIGFRNRVLAKREEDIKMGLYHD